MGKERTASVTQKTKMDQFKTRNMGGGSQREPRWPTGEGCKPSWAQILAVIEASGQTVQAQIAAIAVDVNLLRVVLQVVAERSVATKQQRGRVTSRDPPRGRGHRDDQEVRVALATTQRKSRRQHHASQDTKVIVRPDGTLSLEQHRQEQEEARMLVESVTSTASSRTGSLQGEESPAPDLDTVNT
ncbi:hypothetical protein NDU88_005700 [Pleurodeles waltl]|uniref:Uncharacterized protein n=1 Tax=Pleurodeles waltl TaxID=8319 RepID=A0AAV7TBH6_PLEWA|nr:hypothetical protein NDU88_005700 [Pleurodeles waltl]